MSNPLIQIIDKTGANKNAPSVAPASKPLDLAQVQERLASQKGRTYWRSLEELAGDDEFNRFLEREFPNQAPRDMAPIARRDFLKLMGASLALAGVSGCAFQPAEQIVGYVKQPDDMVPSISQFYATAMSMGGYATGLLAESNMGRPTKIEGNPGHPSSLGATDIFAQASVLGLYDPERSQSIRRLGNSASWEDFTGAVNDLVTGIRATGGAGLHVLTETITSPSLIAQLNALKRVLPQMTWHSYEPVTRDGARLGAAQAFGAPTHLVYRFDRADTILSLDANFLGDEPGHLRYARDFSDRRRARKGTSSINRLYAIESSPTITGAMADHRLPVKPSQVQVLATALAAKLGVPGATAPTLSAAQQKWVDTCATDLQAARGRSIVFPGSQHTPEIHLLAHAINNALGNLNATITGHAPIEAQPQAQAQSMQNLATALSGGRVQALLILGGNPAFTAPADLKFAEALQKAVLKTQNPTVAIHLSPYDDETSAVCTWHLPETHFLEAWGDARGHDGTVSIVQPLIQPLYPDARCAHDILSAFLLQPNQSALQTVQEFWQNSRGGDTSGNVTASGMGAQNSSSATSAFDKQWQTWVHDGIVSDTAAPSRALSFRGSVAGIVAPKAGAADSIEIVFRPDPTIWDGRFANNAWLQELPKPLLKTTWDNAAVMPFSLAQQLNVSDDDLVMVTVGTQSVQLPVVILPGHPDGAITVHYGYGRTRAGKIGNEAGHNVFALRNSDGMNFATGAVQAASGRFRMARTAHHNLIDSRTKTVNGIHERPLVQTGTMVQFLENPHALVDEETTKSLPVLGLIQDGKISRHKEEGDAEAEDKTHNAAVPDGESKEAEGKYMNKGFPSLYPDGRDAVLKDENISYAWGMSVDTGACIGCNACVIGCQAENNSAVTGRDQVIMGRTLHWLRIDTYYHGDVADPEVYFQPVMCMHCEKAPCEPVCPVIATQHSPEGINEMVYNRCIGTRYCSNNCPYKVRRFNYLQYSDQETPQIQLMANPDVTVRARGVMEKCTFCMQRVNEARIQSEKEDRQIRDGEVLTACQQACPTNAIIFGDIRNVKSKVSQLKSEPHNYGMLTELNTYPRVTYLAKVTNPNPALAKNADEKAEHKPANLERDDESATPSSEAKH